MRARNILSFAVLCLVPLAIISVLLAMKSLSVLALWNMSPPILGLILIQPQTMFDPPAPEKPNTPYPHLVGVAVTAALTILFQMAWLFDWDGIATGSSTSGLAFIFVPFWATLVGLGASLATQIILRLTKT